ncbi:hypothetical protein F5972_07975 [Microbispora cellulosiformans]|uniref:Uncharacterized protein n=1 Tax=Microbispora cellulosiformans TaxID=2614688 RepID=A0A5J5K4S7_9ACTN|nr:hypothetical protein [Microbispora cellulosiformans]KAA9379585.1 hypothetical protein F5972_07975 [Microbispora cellulosiformans]
MNGRVVVLVDPAGVVAVFEDWPAVCVVRVHPHTRRRDVRCREPIYRGVPGAPEPVGVPGGRVAGIRLADEDLAGRLLGQRCLMHWPGGLAEAGTEWVPFDPGRHRGLLLGEGA